MPKYKAFDNGTAFQEIATGRIIPIGFDPKSGQPWHVEHFAFQAEQAHTDSDRVLMSCFEAGVPLPKEWQAHRKALRKIIDDPSNVKALPKPPALPNGL